MIIKNITNQYLIESEENQYFDRKSARIKPVDILRHIVAFANANGGVLVVGTSEIEGIDGQKNKPYENTGIQEGDSIISVNDIIVNNTEELIDAINLYEGESVNIKYQRENDEKNCTIKPVKINKENTKLAYG